MAKTVKTRIQNKHDLEINWMMATFAPLAGELIIYDSEIDLATGDVYRDSAGRPLLPVLLDESGRSTPISCQRFKIGDGVTSVSDLPFCTGLVIEEEGTDSIPFIPMAHISNGQEVKY